MTSTTTPTSWAPSGRIEPPKNIWLLTSVPAGMVLSAWVPTKLSSGLGLQRLAAVGDTRAVVRSPRVMIVPDRDVLAGDEHVDPVAAAEDDERAAQRAAEDEQERERGERRSAVAARGRQTTAGARGSGARRGHTDVIPLR